MDREEDRRRYLVVGSVVIEIIAPVFRKRLEKDYQNHGIGTLQAFIDSQPVKHALFHLRYKNVCCCSDQPNCVNNFALPLTYNDWELLYIKKSPPVCRKLCHCNYTSKPAQLDDIDITLASLILLNCCNLRSSGEEKVIQFLRQFKNNYLSHNARGSITQDEYDTLWADLKSYVLQLDNTKEDDLIRLQNRPLDESLCRKYTTMLLDVYKRLEEMIKAIQANGALNQQNHTVLQINNTLLNGNHTLLQENNTLLTSGHSLTQENSLLLQGINSSTQEILHYAKLGYQWSALNKQSEKMLRRSTRKKRKASQRGTPPIVAPAARTRITSITVQPTNTVSSTLCSTSSQPVTSGVCSLYSSIGTTPSSGNLGSLYSSIGTAPNYVNPGTSVQYPLIPDLTGNGQFSQSDMPEGDQNKQSKQYKLGQSIFHLQYQTDLSTVISDEEIGGIRDGVMMDDGILVLCQPYMNRLLVCKTDVSEVDSISCHNEPWNVTAVNNSTVAVTLGYSDCIEMYDINNKRKLKSIPILGMRWQEGITTIYNKLVLCGECCLYIIDHQTENIQTIQTGCVGNHNYLHASDDRIFYCRGRDKTLYCYSYSEDKGTTMTLPSIPWRITSLQDGSLYVICKDGSVQHVSSDDNRYKPVTTEGLKSLMDCHVISYNQKQRKLFTCSNGENMNVYIHN